MKILTLKLDGKTYTTNRITSRQAREAIAINRDLLAFAKAGEAIGDDTGIEEADNLLQEMDSIYSRESALLCSVYGGKFDVDTLENSLTQQEISAEINRIISGIMGAVEKN